MRQSLIYVELESKSDQITALKEAYPDDVWVIKSKKVMGSIEFGWYKFPVGSFGWVLAGMMRIIYKTNVPDIK